MKRGSIYGSMIFVILANACIAGQSINSTYDPDDGPMIAACIIDGYSGHIGGAIVNECFNRE